MPKYIMHVFVFFYTWFRPMWRNLSKITLATLHTLLWEKWTQRQQRVWRETLNRFLAIQIHCILFFKTNARIFQRTQDTHRYKEKAMLFTFCCCFVLFLPLCFSIMYIANDKKWETSTLFSLNTMCLCVWIINDFSTHAVSS